MRSSEKVTVRETAAISNPKVSQGRVLPVIWFSSGANSGLVDVINAHKEGLGPGDVRSSWAWGRFSNKKVFLFLDFKGPVKVEVAIEFLLDRHFDLVNAVIRASGVLLQSDFFAIEPQSILLHPNILIEIPPETTFPGWSRLYRKLLTRYYKSQKIDRARLKDEVRSHMSKQARLLQIYRTK